jgi:hypothetical protein
MYLDTGCSNGSFSKDKPPINFLADQGQVKTANDSFSDIKGKGKIKIGSVLVDTKWVPSFKKNLINDADVLKENKFIIIGKNRFAVLDSGADLIFDQSKITASGTRQNNELLLFDEITDSQALLSTERSSNSAETSTARAKALLLHRSLGHASKAWIKRTINQKGATGIPESIVDFGLCPICETTKGRQGNIPKVSLTSFAPGEAIQFDSQGPFRTTAFDGSRCNMKAIDVGSGEIEYSTVLSVNSKESLSLLNSCLSKLERRTGNKVKYVYTDDGTEFMGDFLQRLDKLGIVKRKGLPYEHHNPGKVERAHQTIMTLGRAMHKDSLLPLKFYPLCHQAAVYLSNRLVHYGESKSPFEIVNKQKPDLAHVAPFGTVCYATLPPEKRDGKLQDTGFVGRLVGYGDDDGLEEVKGYHILRETDQSLHWIARRNVKFDLEREITILPGTTLEELQEGGEDLFNDPYFSFEESLLIPASPTSNEQDEPSGTTANEVDDIEDIPEPNPTTEDEMPYQNTRSRRNAMTSAEINVIRSEVEDHDESDEIENDVFHDALDDANSANYSWFNPNAPNAEFRVNFAEGASKLGVSPELLFSVFLASQDGVALSYETAMNSPEKVLYIEAMNAEVEGMKKQEVYNLGELPKGRKAIKGKWVFRKKFDMYGKLVKIKARWVAKGFTQMYGQDYFETFAAVAKMKSVRTFLSICSSLNLEVFQHDVPQAFLGTKLEEEIWVDQIQGFEDGSPRKCRLNKSLYGLKQSPRQFNKSEDEFLKGEEFTQCSQDSCMYYKRKGNNVIYFLLYVDDCLIAGNDIKFTTDFQNKYKEKFKIIEPSKPVNWFLGLHIERDNLGAYSINQNQYVKNKLSEFEVFIGPGKASRVLPPNYSQLLEEASISEETDDSFPYRNMVGSLMYAMTGTRFDIAFAISVISKFLSRPKKIHCDMVRHIFKYLRGNAEFFIRYKPGEVLLECYADAAYANHLEYRSTLGHCLTLNGTIVDWSSKSQKGAPAQSSSEAEYMSATSAANNVIWFREFLRELGYPQNTTTIFEDNEACIKLSKNPQDHSRTKHIQVRFHVIRQYVQDKLIKLVYVPTKSQLADSFTKCLPGSMLRPFVRVLSQGGN